MAAFIVRRLIWTIPVVLLVILMTFALMKNIGGNPFRKTERAVPAAIQANLERKFNLDKPWYQQYVLYVKDVVTFDFGPSLARPGQDVNDYVTAQFPRSIKLGVLAFLWALVLGLPAGIIAALRPNSIWDYGVMFFSNVGFAIPSFLVATLLIYYFSVNLGWVPTSGWPLGVWELDSRVILPSFALGLLPMAFFARLVRGAMLETFQQDYVRTARAKGAPERRVMVKHILRNAMLPVVTMIGMDIGLLLGGSIFIETVFGLPGLGRTAYESIQNFDLPTLQGVVIFGALAIIVFTLLVDLLYAWIDPRIRLT